jgi:AbrB family looped-hinge helix DNA binding protein
MPIATMTGKGQVTIPKQVRDAFDLHAGDKIEFVTGKEGEIVVRPIKKTVDDVFGRLFIPGRKPLSVEEMNEAIGKKVKSHSGGQCDESA